MENKLDYSLQYTNWSQNNLESKAHDIKCWEDCFNSHFIYPQNADSSVLELGCGMGRLLLMLKEKGYKNLTGVELDKKLYEIALAENLKIKNNDALYFLQNDKNRYDSIYMMDVLEHIGKEKQIEVLSEIFNHLNEDGFLVLQVPNALAPLGMLYRYDDWTHHTSFTQKSIQFILKNSGFIDNVITPQYCESKRIRELKHYFYNLYNEEFNLKDVILTPNIISVSFKKTNNLNYYLRNAPKIKNDYNLGSNDILEQVNILRDCYNLNKYQLHLIRYYFLSKITVGKTRRRYKQKYKSLKFKVEQIKVFLQTNI